METTAIAINADLLANINELLNGATITACANEQEYRNCIELLQKGKRCAADLETEREAKTGPLHKAWTAAIAEFKAKSEPLSAMNKNLANVSGKYQLALQRAREEQQRIEAQKAEDERKRLAKIENDRLVEEQRLRDEAAAKLAEAETKTGAERDALIEQANTAAAVADLAVQEAGEAAQAAVEVKAVEVAPVAKPNGFKAKVTYRAEVQDARKALKWLVDSGETSYLEGTALIKLVEAGCTKYAKFHSANYAIPGTRLVEEVGGKGRF